MIGTAFLKKKRKENIYLCLTVLDLHCYASFSVVVVSRGYSLVVVRGLLIPVVSLGVEPVGCVA